MSEDSIGAMRPCPRQTKRCVVPAQALATVVIRWLVRGGTLVRERLFQTFAMTGRITAWL